MEFDLSSFSFGPDPGGFPADPGFAPTGDLPTTIPVPIGDPGLLSLLPPFHDGTFPNHVLPVFDPSLNPTELPRTPQVTLPGWEPPAPVFTVPPEPTYPGFLDHDHLSLGELAGRDDPFKLFGDHIWDSPGGESATLAMGGGGKSDALKALGKKLIKHPEIASLLTPTGAAIAAGKLVLGEVAVWGAHEVVNYIRDLPPTNPRPPVQPPGFPGGAPRGMA